MEQLGGVLVAGAGPVGLMTALGLAQKGIKVTVIDREPKAPVSPRATTYISSSLKVLDKLGLLDDCKAVAVHVEELRMHFTDTGATYPIYTRVVEDLTPYCYALNFGQDTLANIVLTHLLRLPTAQVRWNAKVTAVAQDAAGVTTTVETPEGLQQLRSDWLIGADGFSSGVRRAVGLEMEGHTWPDRFVATNIYAPLQDYGFAPCNMVHDPVNWAVIVHIDHQNLWRVTFGEDASLPEDEVMRRIPERYKAILPAGVEYKMHSAAPYNVHERAATSFRQGRVLLAGDAAHVCNPCGGMGLTGGIIDADALATALGAVIQGKAGDDVLDFYAEERRRCFWEFASPTAAMHKARLAEADPAKRAEIEAGIRRTLTDQEFSRMLAMIPFQAEGRPMPV